MKSQRMSHFWENLENFCNFSIKCAYFVTISNTQATFAYHYFYDNLRLHVPLRHFLMVLICFSTIMNYVHE